MTADRARERICTLAVLSAMALVVLDAGLVNIALPTIAVSLRVAPADAILAVSAYQTVLVIGLLPCAHIADRVGYRRLFIGGLALFSVASVVCACVGSLAALVAARAAQGLGGAAIMALGIALLRLALGADRLGKAIGWNALTVALCAAAGPIAGAVVLAFAPWPWLFLVKLPISAVALIAARALPEAPTRAKPIDMRSIALHASTALLILVAAGMAAGHAVPAILLASAATVLALALVRRVRSQEAPLWPVDLLALRPFRVSVIASICCFTAQSAGLIALPFHIQLSLGLGPAVAGPVLTCWPLAVAATSLIANRFAERLGSATLCTIGGTALSSGLAFSALPLGGDAIAPQIAGAALSGLGFGLFQVPNNRTLFLSAPPDRSAAAGGMQGTARLIGQTAGALLVGLLFACVPGAIAPRIGFALGAAFAIAAAAVSACELPRASRFWSRRARPRFEAAHSGKGDGS
jgi:DHA2 family multidrug resistance protein-like MFS transporter